MTAFTSGVLMVPCRLVPDGRTDPVELNRFTLYTSPSSAMTAGEYRAASVELLTEVKMKQM